MGCSPSTDRGKESKNLTILPTTPNPKVEHEGPQHCPAGGNPKKSNKTITEYGRKRDEQRVLDTRSETRHPSSYGSDSNKVCDT